jgi:hypothetical protein
LGSRVERVVQLPSVHIITTIVQELECIPNETRQDEKRDRE